MLILYIIFNVVCPDFLEGTSNMLRGIWNNHLTVFHDLHRGFQELESSCWKG